MFLIMLGLALTFRLIPFIVTSLGYTLNEYYPWGFSPMLPVCLFGAACLGSRSIAVIVPLVVWFVGDLAIGLILGNWGAAFYASQPFNYLAYITCIAAGFWLRGRVNVRTVAGLGVITPILFFLVSNFGVWLTGSFYPPGSMGYYPRTVVGLLECYVMGLPFFRYALLSQIVFLPILFSPLALRRPVPAIAGEMAA